MIMVKHTPVGPVEATENPRYAGLGTFARLPQRSEVPDYDVAIVGVPFDGGVSFRPGARFGPSQIREASRLLRPGYHVELDTIPVEKLQFIDAGDLVSTPYDNRRAVEQIQEQAEKLVAKDKRVIALGGDHTIALPMLRATAKAHGPVALLHFDAHLDTWDTYFGAEYTHGTPFRRAFEEGLLDTDALCHVGTRGPLYGTQDLDDDARFGFGIVTSNDVMRMGPDAVVELLRKRVGDRPLYISLDIDVLDPAHAPGTGTPEPGGMTSRELLEILRGLRGTNLVGADVVEVSPPYDHAELTGLAAAHVVYEFMSLLALGAGAEKGGPAYGESGTVYGG